VIKIIQRGHSLRTLWGLYILGINMARTMHPLTVIMHKVSQKSFLQFSDNGQTFQLVAWGRTVLRPSRNPVVIGNLWPGIYRYFSNPRCRKNCQLTSLTLAYGGACFEVNITAIPWRGGLPSRIRGKNREYRTK
jgi:hypothetical protein